MNESIFNGIKTVKYLFEECQDSKHLVVVFSAFSPKDQPPLYNYIKTLDTVKCNKLFILDDFGSRGSYYLTFDNDNNGIEESVVSLINFILQKHNLLKENVILLGSSKGGFASLYYGVKYSYGYAIAGSPQIFIGKYLRDANQLDVLETFLQQTTEEELNNALIELSKIKVKTKIYVHVGKEEQHYFEHVKKFIDKFEIEELDLGDYSSHNDVSLYYPQYLINVISRILGNVYIEDITYYKIDYSGQYVFENKSKGENLSYAWYILDGKNDNVSEKFGYSKENKFEYKFLSEGIYKVKAFTKDSLGSVCSKNTSRIIIG